MGYGSFYFFIYTFFLYSNSIQTLHLKKRLPEPHETQEKLILKKFHDLFSSGQYRLTEKGYK